jgi:LPXTG-motif cell wall-anchored protein
VRRIWMLLVLGLTSVVVLVLGATAAGAQQYPPASFQGPAAPVTPQPSGGGRALSFTGSDTMPLVWIGLAALVAGTLLVVAARRRVRTNRRLIAD